MTEIVPGVGVHAEPRNGDNLRRFEGASWAQPTAMLDADSGRDLPRDD